MIRFKIRTVYVRVSCYGQIGISVTFKVRPPSRPRLVVGLDV